MQKISPHPDKFGFYQVGSRKTYSKVQAIEWQKQSGKFAPWNFNNEAFAVYDWHTEPSTELWDLYKHRAQQIRQSYDYCVIFYSGGSDSDNLLSAWIDADCKIDEIVTFNYYSGSNDQMSYMNAEVTKVAIPKIQELSKNTKFKYRLIDISKDIIDLIRNHADDYAYMLTHYLSPNNHAKFSWRRRINDYNQLINQGKTVCFVWGSEKPSLGYDGRYFVEFLDIIDNCVDPFAQSNFVNGYYDELFYWTPDFPEICAKQAYVLMRFCTNIHDTRFYQILPTRYGYNTKLRKFLTADAVKQIIYPRWNPNTFCDGKPKSIVWSDRDAWFLTSNLPEKDIYIDIATKLLTNIDPYWLNCPHDISQGLKAHRSPRFYLNQVDQ